MVVSPPALAVGVADAVCPDGEQADEAQPDEPDEVAAERRVFIVGDRRDRAGAAHRARTARLDPAMRVETWDDDAAVVYDRALWADLRP